MQILVPPALPCPRRVYFDHVWEDSIAGTAAEALYLGQRLRITRPGRPTETWTVAALSPAAIHLTSELHSLDFAQRFLEVR